MIKNDAENKLYCTDYRTDTFTFEDACQGEPKRIELESTGYAMIFTCNGNPWALEYLRVSRKDGAWTKSYTYTKSRWISCFIYSFT